jgi:hypothetical protein
MFEMCSWADVDYLVTEAPVDALLGKEISRKKVNLLIAGEGE